MGLSFRQAPLVAAGDRLMAEHGVGLARAINDRLRSGIGDGARRIHFYWRGLFGDLIVDEGTGWFWENAQMQPESSGQYPLGAPGESGGVNIETPLGGYIFGKAGVLDSEEVRFEDLPFLPDDDSTLALWNLGKAQRGGFDPDTGALASPSFAAARAFGTMQFSWRGPMGNAYGSWLPTPEIGPACDDCDPGDEYPAPVNWLLIFTALKEGLPDKAYAGSCIPCYVGQYDDHVAAVGRAPWAYYILLNNGTLDILATEDYVEGPYTGAPNLQKTNGGHLARVFSRFSADFRGAQQNAWQAASARPGKWNKDAFHTQRFLTHQYLLAPAKGVEQEDGSVEVTYPEWACGNFGGGELLPHTGGGTTHTVGADCVGALACGYGTKLLAPVEVEVVAGGERVTAFSVPSDAAGTAAAILVLPTPIAAGAAVGMRTKNGVKVGSGGSFAVELAELMDYKPWLHDLMVVHRIASAVE